MSLFRHSPPLPRHTAMLLSPWLLVGSALILGLAITFWAVKNTRQERESMARNLQERSGALMWAIEGGARAGMGVQRTASYLQFMLEEIARQPDIVYLAVITPDGQILAHSVPSRIGGKLYPTEEMKGIAAFPDIRWRITQSDKNEKIFEAFRMFAPLPGVQNHMEGHDRRGHGRQGGKMMGMMHGRRRGPTPTLPPKYSPSVPPPPGITPPGIAPPSLTLPAPVPLEADPHDTLPTSELRAGAGNDLIIIIGLNMSSFEKALIAGERTTLFTALLVGLLGLGGFLSLFWAQSYKISRRMLMDTRAFADEVIESLPLGLIIIDAAGLVSQLNPAAEKLFGRPAASMTGSPPSRILGLDWDELARRVNEGEAVLEEEHTLSLSATENADTPAIPVSVSASRIVNEENETLGLIYLLRDLREVKRLQAELRKNERLSTLGNMAARVAHEIRNPLSSIKGFATFLGSRHDDPEDREAARTMIGEVDRLNRVVSELLDFARPSNLTITPTKLEEIIDRAIRLARMDADTKGVSVYFEVPLDIPSPLVAIDAERITQALLNLLLNAVQSTDKGGSVAVSIDYPVPNGSSPGTQSHVSVIIKDTGRGMAKEVLTQVFSPYYTTRASGTGLGLSIVSKIIEDHHGEIHIESTPGLGTTVTFKLPLAHQDNAIEKGLTCKTSNQPVS